MAEYLLCDADRAVSVIYAARAALEEIRSFQNLETAFTPTETVEEEAAVSEEGPSLEEEAETSSSVDEAES